MALGTPDEVVELAREIAASIARRDTQALRGFLAPGFVHRAHGGQVSDGQEFLDGIEELPGEILFVRLESLAVDVCPTGVLVTGVQHAQLVVEGDAIDDRRGFIDWFVRVNDQWRIQAAVDFAVG